MYGKTNRIISLAMSAAILLTNVLPPMQAYAEDVMEASTEEFAETTDAAEVVCDVPEAEEKLGSPEAASSEKEEEQNISEQEPEPEPIRYLLTLPFYEEASYAVETQHIYHPDYQDPGNRDLYLLYETNEKVEFSFYPQEEYVLTEVRVLDSDKYEYSLSMDENGKVSFTMPDRDIFFYARFEEKSVMLPEEEVLDEQAEDILMEISEKETADPDAGIIDTNQNNNKDNADEFPTASAEISQEEITDQSNQEKLAETGDYTESPDSGSTNIDDGTNGQIGEIDIYTGEIIEAAEEVPKEPETKEQQEEPDIVLTADIEEDGLPAQGSIFHCPAGHDIV